MWWLLRRRKVNIKTLLGLPVYVEVGKERVFDDVSSLQRLSPYVEEIEALYPERFFTGHKLSSFRAKIALVKGVRLKDVLMNLGKVKFYDVEYDDGYKTRVLEVSPKMFLAVGCFQKTEKVKAVERCVFETEFGEIHGDLTGTSEKSRKARLSESFIGLKNVMFGRRQYPVLLLNSDFIRDHRSVEWSDR